MNTPAYRDPLTAALLGILPGAGHLYCGLPRRGGAFLAGTVAGLLLFVLPGLAIWCASVHDAWRSARQRNLEAPAVPLGTRDVHLLMRPPAHQDRAAAN